LEPLKYRATGNDSVRIIELENQFTEKEITKRLISAFNKEINDLYKFIQTSAFEKFFNSGEIYKIISFRFEDLDKEILKNQQ